MQENEDIKQIAKIVVAKSKHSFLSKEDIIKNFYDYGFLVNENTMIGYTSYLEYDETKASGLISFNKDVSLKVQKNILLINFAAFILSDTKQLHMYYNDIEQKSKMKRFARYLIDYSVEKEFAVEDQEIIKTTKEGSRKK